jgi:5-methylcytosine-specific restriction enzyme subunit McrC
MNVVMPETISLREFQSCDIELTALDYATLRARYAGKIDLAPTERAGTYRLSGRDYVGRIGLPDGRVLAIAPKVAAANLFYMLCADVGVADFYLPPVRLEESSDILPFVLSVILAEAEKLVARGLYSDYYPHEQDLSLVKGRVLFGAQVSRYGELKHRHICRYAQSTFDTPENRIIGATLRFTAMLLRHEGEREGALLRRAQRLSECFDEAAPTTRGVALTLLGKVERHRLNRSYWPLLGLCGLVLRCLSLNEKGGAHQFTGFLIDMPRLFESFLTTRLQAALPRFGLRAIAQRHDYLDVGRKVGIRPDVLVYKSGGAKPLLVLDAKYKRLDSADEPDLNRDLYQVSAYMDRYGLSRGVLVYPQWSRPSSPAEVRLRGTPKELQIATLDLAAPTPAALGQECDKLVEYVASLA